MQSALAKQAVVAVATNELAKHEEFDRISVDAICEQAHVSRSSFYRLFQDKYAILEWCQNFPFERGIQEMGRTLNSFEGAKITLQGFGLFENLFFSTYKSSERKQRELAGIARGRELIYETVQKHHNEQVDQELRFQAHWTMRMLLGAAKGLSTQEFNESPEEVATFVSNAVPQRLKAILDAPTNPQPVKDLDLVSILVGA